MSERSVSYASRNPRDLRQLAPWLALAILMLAAGALILWLGRGLTFFRDEWIFLLYRDGHSPVNFLSSHAGHFSLWPTVFFVALFKGVGLDHYEIYRAASIPMHLLCALLVYLIARRRVGDIIALAPAGILLFLGSSWMDILWPFQIGFTGAIAFGLGAILAIDRDDLPGDAAACLLLLVAIGWSGTALPFIPGVAVGLYVGGRLWRRAWVFALPAAAYLAWAAKYGERTADYLDNLSYLPEYIVDEIGAGVSGITGLSQSLGVILACVGLLVVMVRLASLRRSSPLAWEALTMGFAFWGLTALARAHEGDPTAARYVYPSAVFLLLLAVGVAPRFGEREIAARPRRYYWACGAVLVLGAGAIALNIARFRPGREDLRFTSNVTSAELGALELARNAVAPEYTPPLNEFFGVPAGAYFAATDRYGSSPADSPEQIAASPEYARRRADHVSIQALRVRLRPARGEVRLVGGHPPISSPSRSSVKGLSDCLVLRGRGATAAGILPRSGMVLRGPGVADLSVRLKRFATGFSKPVPSSAISRSPRLLRIEADIEASRPWRFRADLRGPDPALLCGVAG
jgi:hypothetical protein